MKKGESRKRKRSNYISQKYVSDISISHGHNDDYKNTDEATSSNQTAETESSNDTAQTTRCNHPAETESSNDTSQTTSSNHPAETESSNDTAQTTSSTRVVQPSLQFTLLINGSKQKKDLLIDNRGKSYTMHMPYTKKKGGSISMGHYWRCANKRSLKCPARLFVETINGDSVYNVLHSHSDMCIEGMLLQKKAKSATMNTIASILMKKDIREGKSNNESHKPKASINSPLKCSLEYRFDKPNMYPHLLIMDLYKNKEHRSMLVTSKKHIDLLVGSCYWKINLYTEVDCSPFKAIIVFQAFRKKANNELLKIHLAHVFVSILDEKVFYKSIKTFKKFLLESSVLQESLVINVQNGLLCSTINKVFRSAQVKYDLYEWRKKIEEQIGSYSLNKEVDIVKKIHCLNLIPADELQNAYQLLKQELALHKDDPNYSNMKLLLKNIRTVWIYNEETNWIVYNAVYEYEAVKYSNGDTKGIMDILLRINLSSGNIHDLEAVQDINVLKGNINVCLKKAFKYWKEYRHKKFSLDELLVKLSKIAFD